MPIGHKLLGNGPEKVLVLHGWIADGSVFEPMFSSLDLNTFTYAFIDFRGYGLSKDMKGSYTAPEVGQDAIDLANHLGWDKFHVIGHSMGGMVTQWVAAKAAGRVKSAIAITPVPASGVPLEGELWDICAAAPDTPKNRGTVVMITVSHRHTPAWENYMIQKSLDTTTREAFAGYLQMWAHSSVAADVQGCQTPLKVLVGEHDPALTADVMNQTVMQWFPKAEMETLKNAGHYPMYEIPMNLAAICEGYLRAHI
jgi:pimeloyl-ACP methyl ester carboxylesterase